MLVKEASGLGSALGADVSSRFLNDVFVCFFPEELVVLSCINCTPKTLEVSGGIWVVSAFVGDGGWGGVGGGAGRVVGTWC